MCVLTEWMRLGFSAGLTESDLDWDGRNHSGDQSEVHLGLYAQAAHEGFFLNASGSYSTFDNEAQRSLAFNGISSTAGGDFDSSAWLGRIEGGYDYAVENWLLSPALALRYISLKVDGFSEGGADFLSLRGEERTTESVATTLGLRAAALFKLGEDAKLIPRAGIFWLHEFMDDAPSITTTFRDYPSSPIQHPGHLPGSGPGPDRGRNGALNSAICSRPFWTTPWTGARTAPYRPSAPG
jgi:outer membrane autotransporter protein